MLKKKLRIYGDNVVECTRTIKIISDSFVCETIIEPHPSISAEFKLKNNSTEIDIKIFPGYGRWSNDVFRLLNDIGCPLNEAPDILITEEIDGSENLILSIEFCSALPAGNQAWQRHGRGYSIIKAGIPYIFITHLGGFELTSERENISIRMPNMFIPFSYMRFSLDNSCMFIPIYIPNPGYDVQKGELPKNMFSTYEDIKVLFRALLMEKKFPDVVARRLVCKCFYVSSYSDDLSFDKVVAKFNELKITNFIRSNKKSWKKKISIEHNESIDNLNTLCKNYSSELISNDLPFCIISPSNLISFLEEVKTLYNNKNIFKSLDLSRPLIVCFIAGFKPQGEDSRPDRGLTVFARMLFGEDVNLISVIYGPMKEAMSKKLLKDQVGIVNSNGLLKATFLTSNAVIIDTVTLKAPMFFELERTPLGVNRKEKISWINTSAIPHKINEHDVDSAIHFLFCYQNNWFEGFCNPPGGDWAGISLIDNFKIHRWLSLPRVSGEGKRPDHIYQFSYQGKLYVFIIESKDYLHNIEEDIGPKLKNYLNELVEYPSSVVQDEKGFSWIANDSKFPIKDHVLITGIAYLKKDSSNPKDHNADVEVIIEFIENKPHFKFLAKTKLGKMISELIKVY